MQEAITLVFERVQEVSRAHQAPYWLHEHYLDLPEEQRNGDTIWRRPNYVTVQRIIESSVYGGAYSNRKTSAAAAYVVDSI